MARPVRRVLRRLAVAVGVWLHEVRGSVAARTLPAFANEPSGLVIELPRQIGHPERMHLGDDVKLGPNADLKVKVRNPGAWLRHPRGEHVEQQFDAELCIGHRVTATAGLQIAAFDSVTIEDDVMFAANVFVSDGSHARTRGDVPYKYQGIDPIAPVAIRRGAWIGQNVVILPGVEIGACALIGANSVVDSDVPAGAIAVGAPARVVRQWIDGAWRTPPAATKEAEPGSEGLGS